MGNPYIAGSPRIWCGAHIHGGLASFGGGQQGAWGPGPAQGAPSWPPMNLMDQPFKQKPGGTIPSFVSTFRPPYGSADSNSLISVVPLLVPAPVKSLWKRPTTEEKRRHSPLLPLLVLALASLGSSPPEAATHQTPSAPAKSYCYGPSPSFQEVPRVPSAVLPDILTFPTLPGSCQENPFQGNIGFASGFAQPNLNPNHWA